MDIKRHCDPHMTQLFGLDYNKLTYFKAVSLRGIYSRPRPLMSNKRLSGSENLVPV